MEQVKRYMVDMTSVWLLAMIEVLTRYYLHLVPSTVPEEPEDLYRHVDTENSEYLPLGGLTYYRIVDKTLTYNPLKPEGSKWCAGYTYTSSQDSTLKFNRPVDNFQDRFIKVTDASG